MQSRYEAAVELIRRRDITRTLGQAGRLTDTDVKATGDARREYTVTTAADKLRTAGRTGRR